MDTDARPRPRPEVAAVPLDDDLVVHDSRTGENYLLNGTAAHIWSLCDGARTATDIAQRVASAYAVDYRQALDDVQTLIRRLHDARLLATQ